MDEQTKELYAKRYAWLRDRLQIRYEQAMSGGDPRPLITTRIGHSFLDVPRDPAKGWTDQKFFDKCRSKVDNEIDAAMARGVEG